MIDSSLQRKDFVSGLVGLVSLAVDREQLEDAETLLACVRLLRPKVAELDFFEAWIAMKRGFWADAMRTLRNLDTTAPEWSTAKAFLAYCQFATGDAGWRDTAQDVLQTSTNAEALDMVRTLLNPEDADAPAAEVEMPATMPIDLSHAVYMRA
jgi:type III secretion protein HrpB1